MADQTPLTPEKAQAAIQWYIRKSSEVTDHYAEVCDAQAEAEADFKLAWAQARTHRRSMSLPEGAQKPTESVLDDYATIQTHDKLKARLLADAAEKATKAASHSISDRLNATRSLAANLREIT